MTENQVRGELGDLAPGRVFGEGIKSGGRPVGNIRRKLKGHTKAASDRASVYRHVHALGFSAKRQRNVRAALERIIKGPLA